MFHHVFTWHKRVLCLSAQIFYSSEKKLPMHQFWTHYRNFFYVENSFGSVFGAYCCKHGQILLCRQHVKDFHCAVLIVIDEMKTVAMQKHMKQLFGMAKLWKVFDALVIVDLHTFDLNWMTLWNILRKKCSNKL